MKSLKTFAQKNYWDILCLILILSLFPLYFYKLGQSSLVSWDEAWYGDIAHNILESGNPLILYYNGNIYSDHPAAGFWIIALFQSIFGVNEFGSRVGSAIFGMIGLFGIYFLGKILFSRAAGLASAFALSSTYWYLTRSRSGDLDIFLTVFFILTILFAFASLKNVKFLYAFTVSLALLLLTKSLVPLTIIPALIIIFFKSGVPLKKFIKPFFLFLVVTLPWFIAQYFFSYMALNKYFQTGAAGLGKETDYLANFKQMKEYLHFGVGKWFWPGILGIIAGPFTLNRGLIALSVFCLSFFAPFILSERGQLWHLIPLYPFMILSFFGLIQIVSSFIIFKFFRKYKKQFGALVIIGMLSFCAYFSYMQIKRSWYEFIDIPAFISDEAILSIEAGKQPYNFYIDGTDFTPAAAFYSNKTVNKLSEEALLPLFESDKKFVLITQQWRLDKYKIPLKSYQVLKTDRDKILLIRN